MLEDCSIALVVVLIEDAFSSAWDVEMGGERLKIDEVEGVGTAAGPAILVSSAGLVTLTSGVGRKGFDAGKSEDEG